MRVRVGAGLERLLTPVWNVVSRGLGLMGVRRPKTRRDTVAAIASILIHVLILAYVANSVVPRYQLDTPIVEQPVPVEIVPQPIPPIPPPPPPKIVPPKPEEVKPPEPQPQPTPPKPEPTPPQPAPPAPTPTPPRPEPPKPEPPKPAPPKPSPLPAPVQQTTEQPKPTTQKLAPAPAPTPKPNPAPVAMPSPAPPTPRPGPPKPNPNESQSQSQLNIHAPAQPAPSNVPTLPMAPAGGQPGKPGGAPATGAPSSGAPGQNQVGGAPGNGLRPFPYGQLPSGGSGLRRTYIGCANADAVRLTQSERDKCNERFGAGVTSVRALDGISPERRRELDAAAARGAADRAYRSATPPGTPPPHSGAEPHGLGPVPKIGDQ